MNIFAELNKQHSLDDLVCVADVKTEEQKQHYRDEGYLLGFTADEWSKTYPSIPAKFIYCTKGLLFTDGLLYIDWEHYIFLYTRIVDTTYISPYPNANFEKSFQKFVSNMMRAYQERDYISLLTPSFSEQSGNIVMALIKQMLLKEHPCPALYDAFIEYYSLVDCGAKQLSPQAMENLIKCKSPEQIETTQNALKKFPDVIQIYRGEGSQSTPFKSAFSWTTDLNRAYFFASWRGGERARVLYATVKKSDVLEYITNRNESEILVLPENVVFKREFICTEWDWFCRLISSPLQGFRGKLDLSALSAGAVKKQIEKAYTAHGNQIDDHDCRHSYRVAFLAIFLYRTLCVAEAMGKGKKDKLRVLHYYHILVDAITYHDIGRKNSLVDASHGKDGYRIYAKDHGENNIVKFLVEYHCMDDNDAKEKFNTNTWDDPDMVWMLYCIMKDADALDRCRFQIGNPDYLDVNFLRLEDSKRLVPMAYRLQQLQ